MKRALPAAPLASLALLVAALAPFVAFLGCGASPSNSSSQPSSEDAGAASGTTGSGSTATPPATTSPPTGTGTSPAPPSTTDAGSGSGPTTGDASAPSSRKRGLAYGANTNADLTALSAGIGWWYNWAASPDSTLSADYTSTGVEYVPMIWGGTFDTTTLAKQIPAGAKYLLTFNEPNFGAQSNLTPAQAAALWPQIQAFADAHQLAIVSPALNYCGGSCNETNPFTWLDAFFAACTGCRVDYVAAHWYACSKSALQGYLSEYETKYDKPLWLTEFSCLDGSLAATDANETTYMTDALALLEADPKVFRYSWFTGRSTGSPAISVLGDAGVLTALGQTYVSLPQGP